MSPKLLRALQRLSAPGARLEPARTGDGLAFYPRGDRRRRPLARFSDDEVKALTAEGVLVRDSEAIVLTDAGRALVRRGGAREDEAYAAQHRAIVDRVVIDRRGALSTVRGHDANTRIKRLQALKDATGAPLLDGAELAAAAQVQADWDAAEAGVLRGSDWTAAPLGGVRGPSNAQERAMAARCDARARLARALDALAPPLRRVVEAVCRDGHGLEKLERMQKWPARSGKLALKLGLVRVAAALRSGLERSARGELDAVHHGEEAV